MDPKDQDFSDLMPLKKAIGNARIVMLGSNGNDTLRVSGLAVNAQIVGGNGNDGIRGSGLRSTRCRSWNSVATTRGQTAWTRPRRPPRHRYRLRPPSRRLPKHPLRK